MRHSNPGRVLQQMNLLRRQFAQSDEVPFGNMLSSEMLREVLAEAKVTFVDRIYTPLTTLLVFLWQVISQDHSCRAAVSKLLAHRVARGERSCSAETGAYCIARKRLPEAMFHSLVRQTGRQLHDQSPADWHFHGRAVKVFDGSTVSMPDTPANQAEYPQGPNQKPGVGFPIARIAAVFSLACGAVIDWAICRYQGKGQSELGLLRLLWQAFQPGDIMLADRYLCSWSELAILQQRGVDFVARIHQARKTDFRHGKRLGDNDHLATWKKPRKPEWMDQAQYDALPAELVVREVRLEVRIPGFRPTRLTIATSLLDAELFSLDDLTELYRQRWHAELDLRSLKQTMQMDVLRCKTPALVRKEISTHLLAYNLVRTIMAQAAKQHALAPRTISFKGALQTLIAFQPHWESASTNQFLHLHRKLLTAIATHRVGDRPDRFEPRKRKRRPKPYSLLTQPRAQARQAMVRKGLK
jgi:hypothetical protein